MDKKADDKTMEKIIYAKIKELLDGMVSVEVTAADGKRHELNGNYVLHFGEGRLDTTFSEITVEGYTSTCDRQTKKFATFEEMCAFLKGIGAADDKFMFLTKCGGFASTSEYESKGRFDSLDMEGILNYYRDADEFELVDRSPVYEKLSDGEVEAIRNECNEWAKLSARNLYGELALEERQKLPEFEQLWQEICEEVTAFLKKVKYGKLKKGASRFICDHVGEDTKYSEPAHFFWHTYHGCEMAAMQCEQAENFKKAEGKEVIFENAHFAPLLPHLIASRMTFIWHCTISGSPARVYRFALNDKTRAWLKQYKSDYDLEELQDLALYKGGKLVFSSCTHEVYHNDYSDK